MKRRCALHAALLAAALLPGTVSHSHAFPTKPVRIVVPSLPGGGTDVQARTLARELNRRWRVPVLVDVRPSPAGRAAAETVIHAPPDGYTLLLTSTAIAITSTLDVKPTDVNALTAVGALVSSPYVLLSQPGLGAESVRALVTLAKAQPDKITYGYSGHVSPDHVCGELFRRAAGIRVMGIPYKGIAQPADAVLVPSIQYSFADVAHALPHVTAGHARVLAVTTPTRYALLPGVPAVSESVPGFEFAAWQALFAPARSPKAVLKKIEAGVGEAMQRREVSSLLKSHGLQPVPGTAEATRQFIRAELVRFVRLMRESGFRAE